jgi:ATP-dependent Zn protease
VPIADQAATLTVHRFVDEIGGAAKGCSLGGSTMKRTDPNQMLVEMDGFDGRM